LEDPDDGRAGATALVGEAFRASAAHEGDSTDSTKQAQMMITIKIINVFTVSSSRVIAIKLCIYCIEYKTSRMVLQSKMPKNVAFSMLFDMGGVRDVLQ
jgi:hypothetical protein